VPPDAQVFFDENPTQQTGEFRTFTSPSLPTDKAMHYDVKARWNDNGKQMEQTRRVEVRAGQRSTVDFTRPEGTERDRTQPGRALPDGTQPDKTNPKPDTTNPTPLPKP
jgi:uncharacterized protein (TIGR03000 family)